ncbi:DUF2243 domain-containing protein [Enterovirga aerilata]|uniref:DUF2243 domain-containing protein n=1 Tax=Enterovirga aerilata TaxID=2730920 RepID=A0A849I6K3_9HYPH|nr:DUF2243 domain-containing protein [Enterovirga sp. DB1703]NNM75112.1 DUF2243 domain-containing protein [Enterovirga sp. DB1703]
MATHMARDGGRSLTRAGFVLGFAFGGFFDGILLHQVLQWHHLLSLVDAEAVRDLRVQILADGLFHVLMYAIASLGLWLLWRGRRGFEDRGVDLRVLAATALGFAVWQFADVVLFHWVLQIHRIRVGVPNPLLWDIGWLVVFGLPSLALGLWLVRRAGNGPTPGGHGRRGPAVAALLAGFVVLSGLVAMLPPPGVSTAMVLFRPGLGAPAAFAAVAQADGRVLWSDPSGELLAVDLGPNGSAWELYRRGALLVGSSAPLAGCLAWSRV